MQRRPAHSLEHLIVTDSQKCSMNNGAFSKSTHRDSHWPTVDDWGNRIYIVDHRLQPRAERKKKKYPGLSWNLGLGIVVQVVHCTRYVDKGASFSTNGF